jgi:hypothetical protein
MATDFGILSAGRRLAFALAEVGLSAQLVAYVSSSWTSKRDRFAMNVTSSTTLSHSGLEESGPWQIQGMATLCYHNLPRPYFRCPYLPCPVGLTTSHCCVRVANPAHPRDTQGLCVRR